MYAQPVQTQTMQPVYGQPVQQQQYAAQPQYATVMAPEQQPTQLIHVHCDSDDDETRGFIQDSDTVKILIAHRSEEDRSNFVKKVMGILGCQLLFTFAGVIFASMAADWDSNEDGSFKTAEQGGWRLQYAQMLYIITCICFLPMIVIPILMVCCDVGRRHPSNWICLTIYTVCNTAVFMFLSLWFTAASMYMAFGTGCGIAFALMAYAMYTKRDFTGCGPYLFVIGMGILIFGLMWSIFSFGLKMNHGEIQWLSLALNFVLIILTCCYIVYYTQLVVGGKHKKHQFEVEDHCLAALLLYAEIMELIVRILRVLGETR